MLHGLEQSSTAEIQNFGFHSMIKGICLYRLVQQTWSSPPLLIYPFQTGQLSPTAAVAIPQDSSFGGNLAGNLVEVKHILEYEPSDVQRHSRQLKCHLTSQ